ncbi:MAG: hypothetical protein ACR2KG_11040 [Nocardioidaceae bacterium]
MGELLQSGTAVPRRARGIYAEIAELLSVSGATAETYTRDARRDEKEAQKAAAWDAWAGLSE